MNHLYIIDVHSADKHFIRAHTTPRTNRTIDYRCECDNAVHTYSLLTWDEAMEERRALEDEGFLSTHLAVMLEGDFE